MSVVVSEISVFCIRKLFSFNSASIEFKVLGKVQTLLQRVSEFKFSEYRVTLGIF